MEKIYHVMTLSSDVNAIQVTPTRQSKNLSRYISV